MFISSTFPTHEYKVYLRLPDLGYRMHLCAYRLTRKEAHSYIDSMVKSGRAIAGRATKVRFTPEAPYTPKGDL